MLRTAVVGLGEVAPLHARAVERTDGVELVAVVDTDAGRVREFARTHGTDAYESATACLDDPDLALDWVHVCTPPGTHATVTVPFLCEGVHALVEKPFALTREDYRTMVETAVENDVRVTAVHNQVFYPPIHEALSTVAEGTVGDLHGVSVRWAESLDPTEPDRGDWVLDLPGGEFGEGIAHPVYVGLRAAGVPADPGDVSVHTRDVCDGDIGFDGVVASFVSATGVACTVQHHSNVPGSRQVEFVAEEGRLVADVPTQTVFEYPDGYGPGSDLSDPLVGAADRAIENAGRAARTVGRVTERRDAGTAEPHDTHTPVVRREAAAIRGDGDGPTPPKETDWTNRILTRVFDADA
jgi:predicted dehydrogenase